MTGSETTVGAALRAAAGRLGKVGIEEPFRDAVFLLSRRLSCPPVMVYVKREETLDPSVVDALDRDITRREKREPAALIVGEKAFFGRDFFVSGETLIPRPETELLTEAVLAHLRDGMVALDVGTGSGCIAVSLAAERPSAKIDAVDVSPTALAIARRNAERHGVLNQISFQLSSLFDVFEQAGRRDFDIIVSNPPYVSTPVLPTLEPELKFEPRIALDGGEDGLAVVRPLIAGSALYLRRGGRLFIEIGFDQGERVTDLMRKAGFTEVAVKKDLDGHDRVVSGVMSGSI